MCELKYTLRLSSIFIKSLFNDGVKTINVTIDIKSANIYLSKSGLNILFFNLNFAIGEYILYRVFKIFEPVS